MKQIKQKAILKIIILILIFALTLGLVGFINQKYGIDSVISTDEITLQESDPYIIQPTSHDASISPDYYNINGIKVSELPERDNEIPVTEEYRTEEQTWIDPNLAEANSIVGSVYNVLLHSTYSSINSTEYYFPCEENSTKPCETTFANSRPKPTSGKYLKYINPAIGQKRIILVEDSKETEILSWFGILKSNYITFMHPRNNKMKLDKAVLQIDNRVLIIDTDNLKFKWILDIPANSTNNFVSIYE